MKRLKKCGRPWGHILIACRNIIRIIYHIPDAVIHIIQRLIVIFAQILLQGPTECVTGAVIILAVYQWVCVSRNIGIDKADVARIIVAQTA
ncbi:hypothetical protein SDC9_142766 [bioreactor metagenome]|uniref:Uncharacterized protein n=1 Tax=bioreactor metagenome TaxID=1076179 RepID=A0A645E222_9ZZZZ